jgi:hypothetical protein
MERELTAFLQRLSKLQGQFRSGCFFVRTCVPPLPRSRRVLHQSHDWRPDTAAHLTLYILLSVDKHSTPGPDGYPVTISITN